MEEEGDNVSPFWLSDNRRHNRRRIRQPSSFILNTGVLITLLLIIAFAFIFLIIPSFLSFTSKIFKPQLVKKSWDSVNLVLVLFAIICGFLSNRSNNDDNNNNNTPSPKQVDDNHVIESNDSTPSTQWYDDRTVYNSLQRLKTSSSYPDLRQESTWTMNGGDDRWRFYDDTHLYNYRSRSMRQNDQPQVYIAVDNVHTSPPPPPPQPQLPPPQLPKLGRRKPKERSEREEAVIFTHSLPSPRLPPPPSQPSPPITSRPEKKNSKSEKKAGKGTKEFLISLRRKKKKERQRSVENLDEFFKLSMLPSYPSPSPPPPTPPPPPPLPSFYQSKTKKHHPIPPLPVKINNMSNVEESVESGNESPINSIPPPPPPPPFKLRPWKFEVQGDFVRIKSIDSSRIDSPDSDDPLSGEASPSDGNKIGEMEGQDSVAGELFCPSPDVNTKADNFIARFRAGLTMEKISSGRGKSNLGPDPGPKTL